MSGWLESKAVFSQCGRYRYRLLRRWEGGHGLIAFCMLNPSTADEFANDPTVERCEVRARSWGYAGLIVVNVFALRSTDPSGLYANPDIEQITGGPRNLGYIFRAVKYSEMFVCGWGKHAEIARQGSKLLTMLHHRFPGRAHALKLNQDGSPAHPLYLPYVLKPQPIQRSSYA